MSTPSQDKPDAPSRTKPDAGRCPICGAVVPPDSPTVPFCSKRCRQIDLGHWLSGDYVISRPIETADLEEE